mgnify:CR=1 FL=1
MHAVPSRGFTLIEVVVALAILATVLMSLPNVLVQAERASVAARRSAVASVAAAEKLEQLRGLAWGFDADGLPVEDTTSDASRSPVAVDAGVGLRASPADSLDRDAAPFVDYLDADGRWLTAAPSEAAGAALVRRWSVGEASPGPAGTLVLRVRVLALPDGVGGGRPRELARLVTVKSRRAR